MTRRLPTILLVAVALAASLHSTTAAQQAADVKAELQQLFDELQAALSQRDRAALERLYADEFLFVHATTGVVDKTRQIGMIMATPGGGERALRPSFDDVVVHGNVAVVRTQANGIQGVNIYVKRDGRWQILQVQGTLVPPQRTPVVIDPKDVDAYVGVYEFGPGRQAVVAREGDTLMWQAGGRPRFPLLPLSSTRFFGQGTASEMTFKRGAEGAVEGVDLRVGICQDSSARKVK